MKKYVEVIVKIGVDGKITPLKIVWENGIEYDIDKVLDMRPAASLKAGGFGTRYLVKIKNKEKHLFQEEDKWFVEIN